MTGTPNLASDIKWFQHFLDSMTKLYYKLLNGNKKELWKHRVPKQNIWAEIELQLCIGRDNTVCGWGLCLLTLLSSIATLIPIDATSFSASSSMVCLETFLPISCASHLKSDDCNLLRSNLEKWCTSVFPSDNTTDGWRSVDRNFRCQVCCHHCKTAFIKQRKRQHRVPRFAAYTLDTIG